MASVVSAVPTFDEGDACEVHVFLSGHTQASWCSATVKSARVLDNPRTGGRFVTYAVACEDGSQRYVLADQIRKRRRAPHAVGDVCEAMRRGAWQKATIESVRYVWAPFDDVPLYTVRFDAGGAVAELAADKVRRFYASAKVVDTALIDKTKILELAPTRAQLQEMQELEELAPDVHECDVQDVLFSPDGVWRPWQKAVAAQFDDAEELVS